MTPDKKYQEPEVEILLIEDQPVTRQQLVDAIASGEKLLKEFDEQAAAEALRPIKPLTPVRTHAPFDARRGVVLTGQAQQAYASAPIWEGVLDRSIITVVDDLGKGSSYLSRADMLRVWEFVE